MTEEQKDQIELLTIGNLVYHHKNAHIHYKIISIGKMQIFNHWFPCVVYENTMGETYVREIQDFLTKFSLVN